jgi:nitrate reductase assembly molybdenum cofactor insertion protein NarJ
MHLLVYSHSETFVRGQEMFKIEELYILTNKIH